MNKKGGQPVDLYEVYKGYSAAKLRNKMSLKI